jgi:dTDP-4-amino-4,6-dideoxygalactose transaminase
MNNPLIDLKVQQSEIIAEVTEGIKGVLDRCDFILGQDVAAFEREFAEFCSVRHSIGVANGTDAINLACRALGIGEGNEVIVPANTFIATLIGVSACGAKPVLVDACDRDYLMDPDLLEAAITPKTRAIIPVHLYGQCADMTRIRAIAQKFGLHLIEDAAQAHGAAFQGTAAGSMGDIGCFSFYPGKNLGAYGDGGACVTQNDTLIEQLKFLRNWGSTRKYYHDVLGFNSRLDTIQAAILRVKLRRLAEWNASRRVHAETYTRLLSDVPEVATPFVHPDRTHVFHLYVVRIPNRDAIVKAMQEAGIGMGIHYPVPCHLSGAFANLGYRRGDFPVSESVSGQIMSLPMFAELDEDKIKKVVGVLREAISKEGVS